MTEYYYIFHQLYSRAPAEEVLKLVNVPFKYKAYMVCIHNITGEVVIFCPTVTILFRKPLICTALDKLTAGLRTFPCAFLRFSDIDTSSARRVIEDGNISVDDLSIILNSHIDDQYLSHLIIDYLAVKEMDGVCHWRTFTIYEDYIICK